MLIQNVIQQEQSSDCDKEGRVEKNQQNSEVGQSQTSGPETQYESEEVHSHSFISVLCECHEVCEFQKWVLIKALGYSGICGFADLSSVG